jgi:hypothetical protein
VPSYQARNALAVRGQHHLVRVRHAAEVIAFKADGGGSGQLDNCAHHDHARRRATGTADLGSVEVLLSRNVLPLKIEQPTAAFSV